MKDHIYLKSHSIPSLMVTLCRWCYRTIMSSLRGPVPIHFTGTPTRFSMNSTYSLALTGKSSHRLHPVVLVSQPPRVSYFISSCFFPEISSSLCKSAGKVSSSFPSASIYAVATLISLKPSKMLVRWSAVARDGDRYRLSAYSSFVRFRAV